MKNRTITTVESPVAFAEEDKSPRALRAEAARAKCSIVEATFAEHWARSGNKTKAYRMAMNGDPAVKGAHAYDRAVVYSQKPEVLEYFDALRALAAENAVVDLQRLIERDMRVVAADDANAHAELIRYVWLNCRHCWGVRGAYQWVDESELQTAMLTWFDACGALAPGQVAPPQPDASGGYGFNAWNEPREDCARCKGLGEQQAIVADTTTLSDAAATLYRGVKQTQHGIEVLTHDTEKARDRLYKAAGAFKDDAASIARGAAAGAALGAAVGGRSLGQSAVVAETMTDEAAARMYLELAG